MSYLIDNWFYNCIFWYKIDNLWVNFESILFLELKKRWFIENETLFYYNIDNYEIDFLVLKNNKIIPIQVSYNIDDEKTFKREIKSLKKFLEKYSSISQAYLIVPFKEKDYNIDWIKVIDFKEFIFGWF